LFYCRPFFALFNEKKSFYFTGKLKQAQWTHKQKKNIKVVKLTMTNEVLIKQCTIRNIHHVKNKIKKKHVEWICIKRKYVIKYQYHFCQKK